MTRNELARRIAEVALLRGEFTLRSGRKSNYYLDKYLFETQPEILKELGEMFAERHPGRRRSDRRGRARRHLPRRRRFDGAVSRS